MTNEENIELVRRWRDAQQAGDERRAKRVGDEILRANAGLVRKFAMRWAHPRSDEDKEDAMQAGAMGLLRALETFDPAKGAFSTHAEWHIRDYVQRFSGKPTAVSRPRSAQMPARVAKAAARFRMQFGREPTAEELGVDPAKFAEWSSGTHFVELDDSDDERPKVELSYDLHEAEHAEKCQQLEAAWEAALNEMSPRNRDIAERVLMKGETTVAVAEAHDLTHGRVVQIVKRIEVRLKRAIDPTFKGPDYQKASAARSARWRAARAEGAAA